MTDDVIDSAPGIQHATKVAKKYTQDNVDGTWGGVISTEDDCDEWKIWFKIETGSETVQAMVAVEKETAHITDTMLPGA